MMEFNTEFPLLEAGFYRREPNKTRLDLHITSSLSLPSLTSSFSFHNHILQGPFLRYIITRIKPNQIGQVRLALIQGKRKGRMEGLRLHSKSELTIKLLANINDNDEYPGQYIISVSGINKKNIETKWELVFPTEDIATTWYDALKKAKDFTESSDNNGDSDKLKEIVKKMREKLNVGNRIYRFKIFPHCFEGSKATQFLISELNITSSQATLLGNRILNLGLIHHISHEHMFVDRKLLYSFCDTSVANNSSNSSANTVIGSDLTNYEKVLQGLKENDIVAETENEELLVASLNRCYKDLKLTKIALNSMQADSSKILELHDKYSTFSDNLISTIKTRGLLYIFFHVALLFFHKYFENEHKIMTISAALVLLITIDIWFLHNGWSTKKPTGDIDSRNRIFSVDEAEKVNIISLDEDGSLIEDDDDIGDDDNEAGQEKLENELTSNTLKTNFDGIRPPCDPLLWPNSPIMIRMSDEMMPSNSPEPKRLELSNPIHIHKPGNPEVSEIPFESDLFIGKAYIIISDLPDSPHSYFRRKLRKFQAIFQGTFKKRTPFSSVYTGQVFDEPINQLPAKWLVRSAISLIAKLQPAVKINLSGNKPYVLSPLASTAQKIIVSMPGQEPSISQNIYFSEEDMSLLGSEFENMDRTKRRAFFSKRSNLSKYHFEPDYVYTFDFYQHLLNLATFRLDLGFIKYDIIKILGLRPVQIMSVDWDPVKAAQSGQYEPDRWPYLWNFEVWNRRAIPKEAISQSKETITPNQKE